MTLARGAVPVMVALRLFLPESWASDPKIALAEIDRMIAAGVRFGRPQRTVSPGANGSQARLGVGIPPHLKVYPVDVQLIWPRAARGRPRQRHIPDVLSIPAEKMLADANWRTISWRTGTKGKLKARFAAVRMRIADDRPQRIRDKGQQHLPGEEAWLIGEHRQSGERKYYLAKRPPGRAYAPWLPPSKRDGSASRRISN